MNLGLTAVWCIHKSSQVGSSVCQGVTGDIIWRFAGSTDGKGGRSDYWGRHYFSSVSLIRLVESFFPFCCKHKVFFIVV